MFASCQVLARGLLITSAHESKLPKGTWVLAGFAVDTSDRGEHIPFMWDREKPSDPPVQARICGNLGKVAVWSRLTLLTVGAQLARNMRTLAPQMAALWA